MYIQHISYPVPAGNRLCHCNDQIGKLYQLRQDLRHIIDKSYYLSLCQVANIYPNCSRIDQSDDTAVYDNISKRIHKT